MSEAIKEDYFCVCVTCDCYFAGDKRAVSCADCAYGEVSAGSSDPNKTECREPVGSSEIVMPLECCGDWARSGKSLGTLQRPNGIMRWVAAKDLKFCPWCGVPRPNDQAQRPPTKTHEND